MTKKERPDCVTDELLDELDALRESAVMNMFGAPRWLQDEHGLTRNDARAVFKYWADTFGQADR